MSTDPRQLALDLPHRPALEAQDFLVSAANAAAVAMIDAWPAWSHPVLVLAGPPGCGKSHLAHVWRLRSGARELAARAVVDAAVADHPRGAHLVVEDIDRGLGDERALFHLLNLAREQGFNVLVTARTPPGDWPLTLPDLRSRLRAAPVAVIEPPDDALLNAVLVKLFADRQLMVEPQVVAYIALRMERSMEAAVAVVAAIDRRALQERRKVSRLLAGSVLDELASSTRSQQS